MAPALENQVTYNDRGRFMSGISFESQSALWTTTISQDEISDIKKYGFQAGGTFDHIFDKLSDYFCGTQKIEAKENLYALLSKYSNNDKKIEAFLNLQAMAGDGFKGAFNEEHRLSGPHLSIEDETGETVVDITLDKCSWQDYEIKRDAYLNKE